MISINTNDYPYGQLEVWAKTCCENQSRIKVKSQWFFGGECEGYFMAYPNPAANYVDIDINRTKMTAANLSTDAGCSLTIYDKTGVVKYKTEFKGFPLRVNIDNLPEGLYFINILYNGKTYTMRVVIEH